MKTALAFSGGKDSFACLFLLQDKLSEIEVLWVNTGKNYPELLATIDQAKKLCPNFTEIIVDRVGQNKYHGLPSDVVPINWTRQGQEMTSTKSVMIQSYMQCCYENIGMNLQKYCKDHGITHLIRGQRNDESHRSTARDGDVVDGITYIQPIECWSSQKVMEYLSLKMDIPKHFALNHSSLDCYDCTAYAEESKDRVSYTKEHHSDLYAEYIERKSALNNALSEAMKDQ